VIQEPLPESAALFDRERLKQQLAAVFRRGLTRAEPYWNFGWPLLTRAIGDLQSGLFYIAAPENVGKSMWMLNAGYQILRHNPDALWIDLSLDDSVEKRIGYLMALVAQVPISVIHRAAEADLALKERRRQAFDRFLKEHGKRLHLLGSSAIDLDPPEPDVRYTAERVREIVESARAANPAAKLFVTIDGFHDLGLAARFQDENDRQRQKSQLLKSVAANEAALIMMSCHCRKDSRSRGLSPDVIKGDDTVLYDAEVVAHLYSDLNHNRENATLYWFEEKQPDVKRPIHELDLLKNKSGDFKGTLFYHYVPERCWDVEAHTDQQELYRASLFAK
jgi:hypothetical protein